MNYLFNTKNVKNIINSYLLPNIKDIRNKFNECIFYTPITVNIDKQSAYFELSRYFKNPTSFTYIGRTKVRVEYKCDDYLTYCYFTESPYIYSIPCFFDKITLLCITIDINSLKYKDKLNLKI